MAASSYHNCITSHVFSILLFVLFPGQKLKTFCYFTNWSNKRPVTNANFDIEDIDGTLCTHLIYAFANINTEFLRLERSQTDDDNGSLYEPKGRYFDFNKLKDDNPHLKTLLSIGGQTAGSKDFLEIVRSEDNLRSFARNCIIYLRDRKFDGIDIDWEWPGDVHKNNFTQLLKVAIAVFSLYNRTPLKIRPYNILHPV